MDDAEGFTIRVKHETSDYLRLLWTILKQRYLVTGILFVFIFVSCLAASLISPSTDPENDRRWVSIFIALFVFCFVAVLLGLTLRRQAKKMAEASEGTVVHFTERGLSVSTSRSNSNVLWDVYIKVVETKLDFLFYPQKNAALMIPKRFFENQEQIDQLRQYLRNSLGERVKLL
jgi:hypothetical protein